MGKAEKKFQSATRFNVLLSLSQSAAMLYLLMSRRVGPLLYYSRWTKIDVEYDAFFHLCFVRKHQ